MAPSFSDGERATLELVAETFVRGGGARRAALAAEAMETALDPFQVTQLRLVLRAFESRPANLALGAGPVRFRDMSDDSRERYLLRWGASRLAMRRSAFAAFRKMLTFIAYADPGVGAPNPLHAQIGYRPTYEPVTTDPTPVRAYPLSVVDGEASLDADVVVVGSGAGGGVVAAVLAEAGRSVVVLEAGALVPETEMPTDELAAYERLHLDKGLTSTWDGAFLILAGGAVGGGTTINWMTSIPVPEAIRIEWARDHGLDGVDGPEFTSDLEAIAHDIDVSPAPNTPPKDAALLRGAQAMGYDAASIETNAAGCGDCGTCPFGCRSGAKRSGLRSHLARAVRASTRVVPDAEVRRVLIDGGRATGVEAIARGPAGEPVRLTVRARQVVVAGGALRTPAVLMRSDVDHPAIGRHLRLHPVSVVAARFAEPIEMWRWANQAARSMFVPGPGDDVERYVIESAPGHPGIIASAFPWTGRDAHAALLERIRWFAPYIGITRDSGEGRLSLTRAGTVRLDYDLVDRDIATLRHALVRMSRIARAAGAQEILAVGTPPLWHDRDGSSGSAGSSGEERAFRTFEERLARFDFSPNRGFVGSAHQMGSARAGAEPDDHPCDPWGRVRSGKRAADGVVRGLYVGDGSLFPTGIGVNPQITVMALARRVARTVLAEGSASA